jgi:hypothetical protein
MLFPNQGMATYIEDNYLKYVQIVKCGNDYENSRLQTKSNDV